MQINDPVLPDVNRIKHILYYEVGGTCFVGDFVNFLDE